MHRLICAGLGAAALLIAPAAADELERQIAEVESITEIEQLAVVTLARGAGEEPGTGDEAGADADPLLAGTGERSMLTAEDADELPPGMREDEPEADEPDTPAQAAEPAGALDENDRQALADAIEANDVLVEALESRGVAAASVVAVDASGGTVIVYVDES